MEKKQKETKSAEKEDILTLSEDETLKMTEDLIVNGFCTYGFNIGKLKITVKSLLFTEQKELTRKLSSIPKIVLDEGLERDKTISEYNIDASELIVLSQLQTINGKEVINLDKMSKSVVSKIASFIRTFNNTIDSVLLSVDNIKN